MIPAAPLTACFIRDQCPARAPCATTATGAWLSFKGTTYEGETFDQIAILPLPADATTAKVEVLVDGVSVWRMPYAATLPPEATWNMAQYPDKSAHTITCNAYDSAGAWTETSTVHVTVNECDRDHDGVPADHAQVAQCPAAAASDCDDSDPAVGSCSGATNACFVAATGAGACGCSVSPDSCVASGGMCNGAASPPVCRAGCALDSDCGAGFFCARALGSGGAWKPTTCTAYCVDDAHCGAGHYCGAADDVASHFACLTCNLAATGPNGTEAHCGTVTTPAGCVACSAGNTLCHNGACTCQSAGTTADTCFAVYTGVCSSGGTCGTCRVDADCASIGGTCASPTCIPGGGWSGIGQFPDERIGASLVYSMVGGIKQVVLFGGRTPAGAGLSDVWVLSVNPASFQDLAWHRVAFDGVTPPARAFHSATMSGTSMIVFGGQLIGPGGTVLGDAADVWQLTLPWQGYGGGFWTQLATPRNAPPPRHSASAVDVYDSLGNDRVVVFGGLHVDPATGAKTLYNDAWSLLLELGGNNAMGWTQLAPTGTPPSPRWGAAGAYDSTNQQLVVYGGNTTAAAGAPTATDAFTLSLVFGKTPVWSPLAPSGNGPGPLDSAVAVYDDAASQMLLFGGAGPTGAPMNDVWSLLLSGTGAPSWMLLAPGPTRPAGGTGYAAAFSPTASTYGLDVFAGNELWTLPSSLSGQWRELAVAPVERDHLAMTWDGANNRVVMFGGMGGVGALMNHPLADTALWSNRYGVWTQLPGSGPAAFSVSTQGTLLNDAADGRYVLFIPRATGPEVWTYTVASATWRRVTTSGGGPASYFSTSAVLDPNGGTPQVVVFGGQDQTGTYLGDTWVLSLLDGSWTMLPAAPAGLGARASHAAIIDAANNRMLVYGGRTINPITSALTNHFDVWALSLPASASSVWTQVSASGTPAHAPAGPPLAVYDANAGGAPRMLVFDSTFPDSSWQLSLAPGAEAWTRLCPAFHPPASLAGRAFGAAVMSPGGLLTYGGSSGSALDNWVWQLASTAPLAVGGACPP